jgi:hypothetical protein
MPILRARAAGSVVNDQLQLFATNGNRRGTKASLGLAKELPTHGAERIVIQLLRRGMSKEHLEMACALAVALDEPRFNGHPDA